MLFGPVLELAAAAAVDARTRTRRASFAVGCSRRATAAGAGCSADAAPAVARSLGAVCQRASGGSRTGPWPQAGRFSGQRRSSCVVGCTRGLLEHSRRDWPPLVSHSIQADGSNAGRRDRPDVTALNRCWSDGMVRMSGDVWTLMRYIPQRRLPAAARSTPSSPPRAAVLHASSRRLFELVPRASRSHSSRDTLVPRTRRVRDR